MTKDIELAPAYFMPLTALASFPRSGNTWTRSLLQIATKYHTSTVYWETEGKHEVLRIWFKGGIENYTLRKGVCVKTHKFNVEHIASFDNGAILLIRNPYHSIISEFMRIYNRLRNVSHPEIIQFLRDNDERWPKEFHRQSKNWRSTSLNWIKHCKRLMIVYYEDLTENPVRELTRMVAFLDQPIKPNRIQCAVYNYKPMASKEHKSQMDFDPYTPDMYKALDGFITEVNETLIKKNAIPLPTYEKYRLSSK
ncbi:WSC domain-containing protein 2 [Holothuria leucospilota]|uniref:WSC domain-containing protein 2 n=1 Tax=Holothuria leucospilota TaxID=206669 RepID=A0A9Q1BFV8_HOLLE|nr:WSC domain-containing protein 2 [Holothuria leucospilota]